jgi:hypothetical protein
MTKSFITAFTAAPGPVSAFLSFVSPLRSEEPRATGCSLPDRLLWDVGVLDTNPDCIRRKPGGTSGVESEMRRQAY